MTLDEIAARYAELEEERDRAHREYFKQLHTRFDEREKALQEACPLKAFHGTSVSLGGGYVRQWRCACGRYTSIDYRTKV